MLRRFLTVLPVVTFILTLLLAAPAWAQAALTVEKDDNPDPVAEGEILTYTIVVGNTGTEAATNVTLTDNLPTGAEFVSVETTNGTCPLQPAPGALGGTVACNLGSLGPDQDATVTIRVRPTGAAASAGTITNTVTADSAETGAVVDQENTAVTRTSP